MFIRKICWLLLATLLISPCPAYSGQSTITEVEGYSCMGEDKSRKQTKMDALTDAKRKAVEYTLSYIKSESKIKNFQLEKDVVEAYSKADVKVLDTEELGWYQDERAGDCFKILIKAEVIPDEEGMERVRQDKQSIDDPLAPLNVKMWTDKKEYKKGEKVKIYIKGNKPFYARVIYNDISGNLTQLLPNPYRSHNYFNGGVIYGIPSGDDQFELNVSPPFGRENITVYASSSPLGDIALTAAGGIYVVKTRAKDVGLQTRAVTIKRKNTDNPQRIPAEFSEANVAVKTLAQ